MQVVMVQFLSINFFSWISSIFVGFFKSSRFFVSLCICTVGVVPLQQDKSEAIKWQSHLYASSILGGLAAMEETKSTGVLDSFTADCGRPAVFAHLPGTKHHYAYKPTYTATCSLS